jgi:hypothetical protein
VLSYSLSLPLLFPAMRFRILFPVVCLLAAACRAEVEKVVQPTPVYARAEVAPTKTSIYLGSVTLTVPTLTRAGAEFVSTYSATVFPFFFFNEAGKFHILLPDADLSRLASGQPVDFVGQALRDDGSGRLVEGRAVPRGPDSGDVKFRVYYTRHIVLIFNTTYRLMGPIK